MGPFILGILFGWLLEWLFYNFWIKGRSSNKSEGSTNISALKSELSSKDNVIADLKAKLAQAETNNETSSKNAAGNKKSATGTTQAASSTKAKASVSTATKSTAKASTGTKKEGTSKAAAKSKAKPATAKTTATKRATKSTANSKTSSSKKTTKAKTTANAKSTSAAKAPAKKSTAVKKTTAKKTTTAKNTKSTVKSKSMKASGDDLTKLSGIGPSMALKLNELGINSYKKLSEMDDDILRDMLEASGARLNNNKEAMDSWNEQAELAAKGDFEGLKKLQEELKK